MENERVFPILNSYSFFLYSRLSSVHPYLHGTLLYPKHFPDFFGQVYSGQTVFHGWAKDCDYKCENTAQLGWKPLSWSEPGPTFCGRPGEVLLGNHIY